MFVSKQPILTEKTIEFFSASGETLEQIAKELDSLDVPYRAAKDDKGIHTLALHPYINPETASLYWDLEEQL